MIYPLLLSFSILLGSCQSSSTTSTAAADQIKSLPGLTQSISFNQYSGYLVANETTGTNFFYWFVEYQGTASPDTPLVLWLNGGPGCSSLGGFLTENGPFRQSSDKQRLELSSTSWNQAAHMLYIESPAGVGFSYSDQPGALQTDATTAQSNHNALLSFFAKFPQYQANPFFITGESYAGHYVPTLTASILAAQASGDNQINLQGIGIGNPTTNFPTDMYQGTYQTWFTHALISQTVWNCIQQYCDVLFLDPSAQCQACLNEANKQMGNIDPYNIEGPVCLNGKTTTTTSTYPSKRHPYPPYDACSEDWMADYLNNPAVQQAIHARAGVWSQCSETINYQIEDFNDSMLPLYQAFFNTSLHIVIYSGDMDSVVPYLGTQAWINDIAGPPVEDWTPWLDANQQVGGYVTTYERMTFVVVRGAGHMVPSTQAQRAYQLFTTWILTTA